MECKGFSSSVPGKSSINFSSSNYIVPTQKYILLVLLSLFGKAEIYRDMHNRNIDELL